MENKQALEQEDANSLPESTLAETLSGQLLIDLAPNTGENNLVTAGIR